MKYVLLFLICGITSALHVKEHEFDLGLLTMCVAVPETIQNLCEFPSEYHIPDAVYRNSAQGRSIIEAIEFQADDNGDPITCKNHLKLQLCSLYFPQCVNEGGSEFVDINITLNSSCPNTLALYPDESLSGKYPLEPCRPLEDGDQGLSLCANYYSSDIRLPGWMVAQLKGIEKDWTREQRLIPEFLTKQCYDELVQKACQIFGQCWSQGHRLEYVLSKEQCSSEVSW